MTVREWCMRHLTENGMREEHAAEVLLRLPIGGNYADLLEWETAAIAAELLEALRGWTDQAAVAWIDDNLPGAWYRPTFAGA